MFFQFDDLLGLLFKGGQGVAIIAMIFWLWVLVDCLTHEPADGNDKVAWTLVILMVPLFGALIYYFVRRPRRIKAASQ